jgi:hypothetical protein
MFAVTMGHVDSRQVAALGGDPIGESFGLRGANRRVYEDRVLFAQMRFEEIGGPYPVL